MRNTWKKLAFVVCAAVALFSWMPAAVADTVTFVGGSGYGPYQTGQGGEFTLLPAGSISGASSLYAAESRDWAEPGTFQSFCLERNEYIWANQTYDVLLSDSAHEGGVAGGNPDPISIGTAWLYWQFARGTLAYNYSGTAAQRKASAGALQNAFWCLEEELGCPASGNDYYNLVIAQFDTLTGARADAGGAYGVKVLNLYDVGYAEQAAHGRQDQLILVPEPASILGLGTVLFLIGSKLRRKRA